MLIILKKVEKKYKKLIVFGDIIVKLKRFEKII